MKFINFDDIFNKNNENYINKNQYLYSFSMFQIQLLLDKQDLQKLIHYYSIF